MEVLVRRQWNDFRDAEVELDALDNVHWDTISGGVRTVAPQPFIHAYVWCDGITGDIAHSCRHSSYPHRIKVAMVKKSNTAQVWATLLEIAGPRPSTTVDP
jgi:hypothetical protein